MTKEKLIQLLNKLTPADPYIEVDAAHESNKLVVDEVMAEFKKIEDAKNNAYWERNQLLVALSKLMFSALAKHDPKDKEWEDDWRNIVAIYGIVEDFTITQMTWHIHDSELKNFDHLKLDKTFKWDGHTTEEKYNRLMRLKPNCGIFEKEKK